MKLKRYSGDDYLSEKGAKRIAFMVNAYWTVRNKFANARIEPIGDTGCFAVRSDLVNGLPHAPAV